MLQCVAARSLQCVAVCCSVLQCAAAKSCASTPAAAKRNLPRYYRARETCQWEAHLYSLLGIPQMRRMNLLSLPVVGRSCSGTCVYVYECVCAYERERESVCVCMGQKE